MAESEKKTRRVRHDIVSEILEIALKGARKTHIMYRTNLSYSQFMKYLDAMQTVGLIKEESGVWRTTESGKRVVEACKICSTLMSQINIKEKKSKSSMTRS